MTVIVRLPLDDSAATPVLQGSYLSENNGSTRLMITEVTLADEAVAAHIHALLQAAYALEARIIGCSTDEFPPLRESLDDLRQSSDRFLIYQQSPGVTDPILGVLSFAIGVPPAPADLLNITRLVVCPAHLRQGIATALLAVLEHRVPSVTQWTVSTAESNEPAVHLYQRLGCEVTRSSITAEGISLLHFIRSREGQSCPIFGSGSPTLKPSIHPKSTNVDSCGFKSTCANA